MGKFKKRLNKLFSNKKELGQQGQPENGQPSADEVDTDQEPPASSSKTLKKLFPSGLKRLHDPETAIVDIVFIHGLTGDREKTWTAKGAQSPWPQYLLPTTVPQGRILTFGYDAYVADWRHVVSKNRIGNHAKNLLSALSTLRDNDDTNDRPIIFVAHSLGGLVCQDAILASKNSPESHHRQIFACTSGILFLGTPHAGSALAIWAEGVSRAIGLVKQTNPHILRVLKDDSEVLERIQADFHAMLRTRTSQPIHITCCYEELPLPVIGEVVPKRSATLLGYTEIGIHANHMDMTRFESVEDPGFVVVSGELRRLVRGLTRSEVNMPPEVQVMLKDLFILDPETVILSIQNQKDKVLEGTGSWLYEGALSQQIYDPPVLSYESAATTFSRWVSRHTPILWIYGGPGKGKTMLAISAVKKLAQTFSGSLIGSFFFANTSNHIQRNNGVAAIRCLLWQILNLQPELSIHLRTKYQTYSKEFLFSLSEDALLTLLGIFDQVVKDPRFISGDFIIDGIDECEQSTCTILLDYIGSYSKQPSQNIRWLITSRWQPSIRDHLSEALNIDIEANRDHIDTTINQYITQKTSTLAKSKSYPVSLTHTIEKILRISAEGTFLWVSLACSELSKSNVIAARAEHVLRSLPRGLIPLYGRMLFQVLENDESELVEIALNILRVAVVSFRPLTLQELAVAAYLPLAYQKDSLTIRDCILQCGAFLQIQNPPNGDPLVHLVHRSAIEFLAPEFCQEKHCRQSSKSLYCGDPRSCGCRNRCLTPDDYGGIDAVVSFSNQIPFDIERVHLKIATACLEHILMGVFASKDLNKTASDYPLAEYAILFWVEHTRLVGSKLKTATSLMISIQKLIVDNREWGLKWFQAYFEFMEEDTPNSLSNRLPSDISSPIALHLAAWIGIPELIGHLFDIGSKLTEKDLKGDCPLAWSASSGHVRAVHQFLKAKADINAKGDHFGTPLQAAARSGHIDVQRILIESGADVNLSSGLYGTALQAAARGGHTKSVELLIENGADVMRPGGIYGTALQAAAMMGDRDIAKILINNIEHKISALNQGTGYLGNPVQAAAYAGHTGMIKFLLDEGADVGRVSGYWGTALQAAAAQGHGDSVHLLLERGADMNAEGKYTSTLQAAIAHDHKDIIRQLHEHETSDAYPPKDSISLNISACISLCLEKWQQLGQFRSGKMDERFLSLRQSFIIGKKGFETLVSTIQGTKFNQRGGQQVELFNMLERRIEEMTEYLDEIISLCISGKVWSTSWESDDLSSKWELDDGTSNATSSPRVYYEVDEYSEAIMSCLENSCKIIMMLRHWKVPGLIDDAASNSPYKEFDIRHVQGVFPGASVALTTRLALANTRRRETIKLHMARHNTREVSSDSDIELIFDSSKEKICRLKPRKPSGDSPFLQFDANHEDTGITDIDHRDAIADDQESVASFASSASNASSASAHGFTHDYIHLPSPPPDMPPFCVCPLCFMPCPLKLQQQLAWKRHLMRDLKPYLCLFEDCPEQKLLHNRGDWFKHEEMAHRRRWACCFCEHTSSTEEMFLKHITIVHEADVEVNDADCIERLLRDCRKLGTNWDFCICPLCQGEIQLQRYRAHVAGHLERLATFAIPRSCFMPDVAVSSGKEGSDIQTLDIRAADLRGDYSSESSESYRHWLIAGQEYESSNDGICENSGPIQEEEVDIDTQPSQQKDRKRDEREDKEFLFARFFEGEKDTLLS